ncbi:MAG: ferritin family protein [bacterium]
MSSSSKLTEVLKLAIEFEKEGREYFLKAVERTSHPLGKKMFKSLADDELAHMKQVKSLYDSMVEKGNWPDKLPQERSTLKTVFEEAMENIDKNVKGTEDDISVLEEALKLEIKGNSFYHDLYIKAAGKKEKEFFQALANEEAEHFEILQNTKTFLQSPADYYQEIERPIYEG